MAEEETSASGQYTALGAVDISSSYRAPDIAVRVPVSAPSAAPMVTNSQAPDSARSTRQPSSQEIDNAIAAANANLSSSGRVLDYRMDAATGISVAVIRNSQTGAVLQQMPGADIIALARMLAEWAPGKHTIVNLIA